MSNIVKSPISPLFAIPQMVPFLPAGHICLLVKMHTHIKLTNSFGNWLIDVCLLNGSWCKTKKSKTHCELILHTERLFRLFVSYIIRCLCVALE